MIVASQYRKITRQAFRPRLKRRSKQKNDLQNRPIGFHAATETDGQAATTDNRFQAKGACQLIQSLIYEITHKNHDYRPASSYGWVGRSNRTGI